MARERGACGARALAGAAKLVQIGVLRARIGALTLGLLQMLQVHGFEQACTRLQAALFIYKQIPPYKCVEYTNWEAYARLWYSDCPPAALN